MASFDPDKITFFAKTDARGQDISFGIKAKDRQRHMYVVGKTGMGKSTLLENMAAQDIANGEGMAFIDPHGSAAETLLDYVPAHRVQDVVYFAPFDLDNPVSFNVMEDVGPDKRHLVVSGLMSTFKKVWVDAWSARMEYILTNALLVLIEYPETTLLSVNRLFSDKVYREKVVDYCKDPAVKAYWTEEYANYTERFAAEALPAIQNKIGQFTGNPLIRNIIGQPHSSFDIRKMMDEKKILIMNLSKGLIGETNANLLGSMLTTRIYLAAMSRANLPVAEMKQMPNFYFYVDEFQSFANSTFANILSEARKYHLNLIIAHQYIAQMEEEVRDAVFGNVGTTIAFRVGPFDGEVLETVFEPTFLATDLVNLGFAQIYLTLMIDGIGSQPFSAKTLPPVEPPAVSSRDLVIESSRRLYAKDRGPVEELVTKLHARHEPEKKEFTPKNGGGNNNGRPPQGGGGNKPYGSNNAGGSQGQRPNNNGPRQNGTGQQANAQPASKSPEELRALLAKVAGKDETKQPAANKPEQSNRPSPASPSETPAKKPDKPEKSEAVRKPERPEPAVPIESPKAPERPSAPDRSERSPGPASPEKSERPSRPAQPERSGKPAAPEQKRNDRPKPQSIPQFPKQNMGEQKSRTPKTDSSARDALKAALSGVLHSDADKKDASPTATTIAEDASSKSQSTQQRHKDTNTSQQAHAAPKNTRVANTQSVAPIQQKVVTSMADLQATLQKITATTAPPAPVEAAPQKAATAPVQTPESSADDPLDPKKIKQMLRQSGNERSPFHDP